MKFIATGKIADYIHTNPQSRVTLLTWLKESDYWIGQMFAGIEGHTPTGFGNGSAQPGTGGIVINYQINYAAKALCITDIKSQDEIMHAFKAQQQKHTGLTSQVKVATITLTPPPPLDDDMYLDEFEATADSMIVNSSMPAYNYRQDLKHDDAPESNNDTILTLTTEAEYQTALARAISLFNSQVEDWSYNELLSLLPSIKRYEREHIRFPTMSLQEVIAERVNMFNLPENHLSFLVGGKENMEDLLDGKVLPINTMETIFRTLGLRFPLNDRRFFE